MDTSQVEHDLQNRIEQSRIWVNDEQAIIKNIKFRNHNWAAKPVAFIDDPSRVERHGLKFELYLDEPGETLKVHIMIRIKPIATIGPKADSPPLVVIYVLNQKTGVEEAVTWNHIQIASTYEDLVGISLDDWYRKWIVFALNSKKSGKILRRDMRLEQ